MEPILMIVLWVCECVCGVGAGRAHGPAVLCNEEEEKGSMAKVPLIPAHPQQYSVVPTYSFNA